MEVSFFKKYRWAITISMMFACVFLLYMTFIYNLPHVRNEDNETKQVSSNNSKIYRKLSVYDKDVEYPFVQTDISNIFYVANPKDGIRFYTFKNNKFKYVKVTKTLKVSLTLNSEKIPLTINYLKIKGKTLGYGIYISKDSKSTNQYAFLKLCDMPKDMIDKYDLLLLIDYDSYDVFSSNKTYSEVFQLSSKTKKATRLISENDRKISIENGKLRDDFSVVTDHSVNNCNNRLLFLSARNYKISKGLYCNDIYTQDKYTKYPKLVEQNVIEDFFVQSEDSIIFLKKNSEFNNGFSLIKKVDGKEDKIVKKFAGKISKGYKLRGDYLLDYNTMTLYNLVENSQSTLLNLSLNKVNTFDVSPDKTRVVIVGSFDNGKQRLIFYDLKIKRYKIVNERNLINEDYPNLRFIDKDKISYIRPSKSDTLNGNIVVSWDEIFSKLPS